MTRPAFLTRPYDWTQAARTAQSRVDYACSVQHNVPKPHPAERWFFPLLVIVVTLLAVGYL